MAPSLAGLAMRKVIALAFLALVLAGGVASILSLNPGTALAQVGGTDPASFVLRGIGVKAALESESCSVVDTQTLTVTSQITTQPAHGILTPISVGVPNCSSFIYYTYTWTDGDINQTADFASIDYTYTSCDKSVQPPQCTSISSSSMLQINLQPRKKCKPCDPAAAASAEGNPINAVSGKKFKTRVILLVARLPIYR